ncbi:hypothetical protein QBC43DRAFT_70603 [Cladorrhinum sp. PSN259]|nr:hypothetical protein QBC43DRAFT_70603 [Cladorrhinum sp. PSN259]
MPGKGTTKTDKVNRVERLPNELLELILSQVPFGQDLVNLICASRPFLKQWNCRGRSLLPRMLAISLGPAMSDAILSRILLEPTYSIYSAQNANVMVKKYHKMRQDCSHSANFHLLNDINGENLDELIRFHFNVVEPIIPVFLAWVSANFQRQTQVTVSASSSRNDLDFKARPLTFTERSRIAAALYQYQIVCCLYRAHNGNKFPSCELDWIPFYAFALAKLQAWEIEQVLTVEAFFIDVGRNIEASGSLKRHVGIQYASWEYWKRKEAPLEREMSAPLGRKKSALAATGKWERYMNPLPDGLRPFSSLVVELPTRYERWDDMWAETFTERPAGPLRNPTWAKTIQIPVYNKKYLVTHYDAREPDLEAPAGWKYNPQRQGRMPARLRQNDPEFWDIWFQYGDEEADWEPAQAVGVYFLG